MYFFLLSGYLYHLTKAIVDSCNFQQGYSGGNQELLKGLTKPFTSLVVRVSWEQSTLTVKLTKI